LQLRSVSSQVRTVTSKLDRLPRSVRGVRWAVAALVVALVIVPAALPHRAPTGIVLQGMEFGAINGIAAIGLVLTYRSSRIINFAYGAMGGLAASITVMLTLGHHWNWFAAIACGLLAGALLGLGIGLLFTVFPQFFNAPRLVVTVATIALALGLGWIESKVPSWIGGPPIVGGFKTPLTGPHVVVGVVTFHGDDLLIVGSVIASLLALGWFLMRTDAGVAVRAVSDNSERAMLLGIPVRRLSVLVWVIAGVLAALTIIVSAPSQGLALTEGAGPELILAPLAAACVAGMESLPLAVGAGVGIGIVDQIVGFNFSQNSIADVVNFVVILLALLLMGKRLSRAQEVEGSWLSSSVVKPIPQSLRRLPEVVAGRLGLLALVLAGSILLPFVVSVGWTVSFIFGITYAIVLVSLVVLSGWSGSVSLGQFAIAGLGGVVAGDLMSRYNVDLFFALAAAGAAGAVLALLVGWPALRIRGLYLAVITLALGVMLNGFFFNPTNFNGLIPATITRPVLWKRFDLGSYRTYYLFCLAVLVLVIVFVKGLRAARAGRVLLATRDNERAAAAMAVPTVRAKLVGFVLAGVIAGIGGALYAGALGGVGYDTWDPLYSTLIFVYAVIGGLGSMLGGLLVVATLTALSHWTLLAPYSVLISSFGVILVLMVNPGGNAAGLQTVRDKVLKVIAERRGILVPSLVADRRVQDPGEHPPKEDVLMAGALSATDGPLASDAEEAGAGGAESAERNWRYKAGARTGDDSWDPGEAVLAEATEVVAAAAGAVPDTAAPMLRCSDIEISYGPVQVLFGVDLEVHAGEIVALLGTNGAGKSTLLKGVSGLVKVSGGGVELEGRNVTRTSAEAMARHSVSLMPGGRGVFPTLSVEENLRLGTWLLRKERQRAAMARRQALELFPILARRSSQMAGNLSGGEQQMLSLAMALMVKPRLLMIDELSLGLAPTVVSELIEVVRMLHATGTTILVVEQSVNVALELAERAVFMEKGEVRFAGPTAELLARPDILRSVFIAGASAVTGGAPSTEDAPTSWARPAAGAQAGSAASGAEHAANGSSNGHSPPGLGANVILECRSVSKNFGGIRAVDSVDIELREGEILGLIGHNGAGKTTLFDMVSGFLALDGGRVLLGDMDIGTWPAPLRAMSGIGRTFQEAKLFPSLTVTETISVALERHLASRDLIAAGLRLPACLDSEAEVAEKVGGLVDAMGLGAFAEKLVGELSTGTRRIVELACVLAQDPAVVLLDEPSGGVAQRETEALGPLLKRVQTLSGCSLLVIEHDMPLLSAICDRMIALELGEVIATGTPAEVLEHPMVIESYLGTDESTIRRSGARLA
jgi:ABC-type branched-subunit amino acid transport system ATPase component/ABC-type branched-subunit amino acid transport system permease subunit